MFLLGAWSTFALGWVEEEQQWRHPCEWGATLGSRKDGSMAISIEDEEQEEEEEAVLCPWGGLPASTP